MSQLCINTIDKTSAEIASLKIEREEPVQDVAPNTARANWRFRVFWTVLYLLVLLCALEATAVSVPLTVRMLTEHFRSF